MQDREIRGREHPVPAGQGDRARDRGVSALEFVLVASVLLLIMLALFDMGRAVYLQSALQMATFEAARAVAGIPDLSEDDVKTIMVNRVAGLDEARLQVSITYPESGMVQVTAHYPYQPVTPTFQPFFPEGYELEATVRLRY